MGIVDLENISFAYEKNLVLENITLSLNRGETLSIIGPNGGGKSTLAKVIVGLLKPSSGRIFLDAKVGYVSQITNQNLEFPILVKEVINMGFLGAKIPKIDRKAILEEIATSLKIEHLLHRKIAALSGGERQKVLIARALCARPSILLLDEPTANIDVNGQKEIFDLLEIYSKKLNLIIISHDISSILRISDKILYVNKNAYMHDAPSLKILPKSEDHLCEIDLLNFCALHH